MNELQQRFLALAKKKEDLVRQLKRLNIELDDTMRQLPLGEMFQDPADGVVYQVIIPAGTFVEFKSTDYIRTRKEGETKGSLSMKEAQAAGFVLGGKIE
jgi:hypothetical protein